MKCPAAEGWQQRMLTKAELAGGAGLVGGGLLAVTRQGPPARWALATAASCAICATAFSGCQEAVRALRCEAGPANSLIAGGAAGYLVMAAYAGKQKAAPAAVVCAAAAGAADVVATWADVPRLWRRTLVALDLLDPPTGAAGAQPPQPGGEPAAPPADAAEQRGNPEAPQYFATGTWRDWLPVRKLSEAEWAEHQRRKAEAFQRKIDRATKPPPEQPPRPS